MKGSTFWLDKKPTNNATFRDPMETLYSHKYGCPTYVHVFQLMDNGVSHDDAYTIIKKNMHDLWEHEKERHKREEQAEQERLEKECPFGR